MTLNLNKAHWKHVTLGEVAAASKEKVDPSDGSVSRFVAGEHMKTDSLEIHKWGEVGEIDLGPAFHRRFRPGQVLYGSRRTYLRKVAVAEFDGVCANTTFVVSSKDEGALLNEFLPFIMTAEPFHAFAIAESKGSVNPYVNWSDIERYEFDLPPLDDQRRIADLLWAVERHRLSVGEALQAVQRALQLHLATSLAALGSTRRLGDVVTTRSGPSFAASSVASAPIDRSIPVLGIPNTRSDGTIDLSDVGHVSGLPASTWTLDGGSLILIRTNGNRQRIGNVYLPPADAYGYAVSAFQFLMRVNDPPYREYVYRVLKTDAMQSRMSEAASGTTGLSNLAVNWLNDQEIPWPDVAERDSILANVDRFVRASSAISQEGVALASLRSALSNDIFGAN